MTPTSSHADHAQVAQPPGRGEEAAELAGVDLDDVAAAGVIAGVGVAMAHAAVDGGPHLHGANFPTPAVAAMACARLLAGAYGSAHACQKEPEPSRAAASSSPAPRAASARRSPSACTSAARASRSSASRRTCSRDVAARCGDAHWARCDVADREQVDARRRRRRRGARRPRRRRRQRRDRRAAAARRRRPRGDGAHAAGQRARRLLHAARGRPAHQPPPTATRCRSPRSARSSTCRCMGAYSASKAAVEALGNTLRIELRPVRRARRRRLLRRDRHRHDQPRLRHRGGRQADSNGLKPFMRVAPLKVAIDALERGIARRSRRVVAPGVGRAAAAAAHARPAVRRPRRAARPRARRSRSRAASTRR